MQHRLIFCLLGICATQTVRADWPTLHNDYQRSGYTDEVVSGPYERKWWRDFHDEMIATRCEAIVADGRVFVGTFAGHMYALGVTDGQTLWRYEAKGPIGASPCCCEDKVYFGSDDAFDRGTLYCLNASDGTLIWSYRTAAGIWTSPACDGDTVYVGDRAGTFHAVDTADGSRAWTYSTGNMILKPASLTADGRRIVVGSEDMHVYCLAPDGTLLWQTAKLPGLSMRDQGATIWQGLAIVRTNPADAFHTVLGRNGELLEAIQRAIPLTHDDQVLLDKWGDLLLSPRPKRRRAENLGVVKYLKANRYDQCFFAFDLQDGSQPWIAPVLYTAGLHNPPTPPTFHPRTGQLYTLSRSALTHYVRGVRRYSCLVRIDRRTGLPDWVWPERDEENWRNFPMIPDETQALGMMGNLIVGTHQGELGALDPATGAVTPISRTRDTYAGIFGPGALRGRFEEARTLAGQGYLTGMPNEWHGPDRGIVAISHRRIFWLAGSQVVCIAGPDIAAGPTGGADPPPPLKMQLPHVAPGGNVADRGAEQDAAMPTGMQPISVDDLHSYINAPAENLDTRDDRIVKRVRPRLDAAVLELVHGSNDQPWAPLIVELGISGQERYFWRTAETMQIVSLALPHLSLPVRSEAVAYLDRLFHSGCPLQRPTHAADGARREPFELGRQMASFAARTPSYEPGVADLYALWAYARWANRWPAVLGQREEISELFDQQAPQLTEFNPDDMQRDSSQMLNRRIGGVLAAVRIFDRAGDHARRQRAVEILATLLTIRVHHELSDPRLVRPTRGEQGGIHRAKIPRYVDVIPELTEMLHHFAGDALDGHLSALRRALPLWYQAYGERMIGGENYISPPHLSRGIFMAWADSGTATPGELAAKLDQPWCRADLYYIEKCSALLRAAAR